MTYGEPMFPWLCWNPSLALTPSRTTLGLALCQKKEMLLIFICSYVPMEERKRGGA